MVLSSAAVKDTGIKSNSGKEKVYFASASQSQFILERRHDRNSERAEGSNLNAETDAETKVGLSLLRGGGLAGLYSLLSPRTQDHRSRGGTAHSGLGLPTSTTNQGNISQACQQAF